MAQINRHYVELMARQLLVQVVRHVQLAERRHRFALHFLPGQPPEQDVGVEQQPHGPAPRNSAAITSSAASKPAAISTRPSQRARLRRAVRGTAPQQAD
jgi:hypothetical protein